MSHLDVLVCCMSTTRLAFDRSVYSRRMSRAAYCYFIVDNKRCSFFSESTNIATTYRGHIDGHAA